MVRYLKWSERSAHNRGHPGSTPGRATSPEMGAIFLLEGARRPARILANFVGLPFPILRHWCSTVSTPAFQADGASSILVCRSIVCLAQLSFAEFKKESEVIFFG